MTRPLPGPFTARRLAAAVLALVAMASLTACEPDQLGAAAIVDGDRITVSEVQDATEQYLEAVPDADAATAQKSILERMILSRIIARAADKAGVSVSAGQVASAREQLLGSVRAQARKAEVTPRAYVAQQLAASQQQTVVAPSYVNQWVRDGLLFNALAQQGAADPQAAQAAASRALMSAAGGMDIDVNPRYGRWDPRRGLRPELSGGLSKSVEELTGPTPGQE